VLAMSAKAVATHLVAHKKIVTKKLPHFGGGVFYLRNENRTFTKPHKVAI